MKNRKLRVILWILALGVLGYWGVRFLLPVDPAQTLKQTADARSRGIDLYEQKRFAEATSSFDAALGDAQRGMLAILAVEKRKPTAERRDELRKIAAELNWHTAAALRDAAYSRAAQEGKPLPTPLDASLNQPFRSYLAIPERERRDAVAALRRAVQFGNEDPELLLDALRMELMIQPISWRMVEYLAKTILKSSPSDLRAQYLLARSDFEQPNDSGELVSADRRKRKPAEDALDRIEKLKEAKDYPIWRVWHLEAKIRQWLADDSLARKEPGAARTELAKLADLLWNRTAALDKARAGEGMNIWSNWDAEGMVGLFQIAFDLKLREVRSPPSDAAPLVRTIEDYLAFCRKRQADAPSKLPPARLAARLIDMLVRAQPYVSKTSRPKWLALLNQCDAWLDQPTLADSRPAEALHPFALLFLLESATERSRGDAKLADQEARRAEHWLQDGLRLARIAAKTSEANLEAPFLFSLALMKLDAGAGRSAIADLLGQLRANTDSAGYATLLEASLALREGQLERTLDLLNQMEKSQTSKHRFRIPLLQVKAYRGLNSLDKALNTYRGIERTFADWDELSVDERISLLEAYPRRDRLDALVAITHLDLAADKYATAYRESPKKAAALDFTGHETAVRTLVTGLPKGGDLRLQALQHEAITWRRLAQREKADVAWKMLRDEAPNHTATWATALALAIPDEADAAMLLKLTEPTLADAKAAGLDAGVLKVLAVIRLALADKQDEAKVELTGADASKLPSNWSAFLPLEFVEAVGNIAVSTAQRHAWRPTLAVAQERFPYAPSTSYFLGWSYAADRKSEAEFWLRRADNLARCRPLGSSTAVRERWQKLAQSALEAIQ